MQIPKISFFSHRAITEEEADKVADIALNQEADIQIGQVAFLMGRIFEGGTAAALITPEQCFVTDRDGAFHIVDHDHVLVQDLRANGHKLRLMQPGVVRNRIADLASVTRKNVRVLFDALPDDDKRELRSVFHAFTSAAAVVRKAPEDISQIMHQILDGGDTSVETNPLYESFGQERVDSDPVVIMDEIEMIAMLIQCEIMDLRAEVTRISDWRDIDAFEKATKDLEDEVFAHRTNEYGDAEVA